MNVSGFVCAVFLMISCGCGRQSDAIPQPPELGSFYPLNIIVILDTSDRISKEKRPDQAKTDILIAQGIVNLFADRVLEEIATLKRDKWFRHSLTFVVPEQPNTMPIPQNIIRKLKIWPPTRDKDRVRITAADIKKRKDALLQAINELYSCVDKQEKFTGSDIWEWFRSSGEEYLKPNKQNYIICLSDGYLDFDNDIQAHRPKRENKTSYTPYHVISELRHDYDWKQKFNSDGHGLLEIGKDFSNYNAKFLMVEIRLRDMLDLDILKEYWQQWLGSMKINHAEFIESQADPQIVIKKIEAFME